MFKKSLAAISILAIGVGGSVYAADQKPAEWKTHIELSYVVTSGNTDTQTFASKAEVKKEEQVNRYYIKFEGLYAKNNGSETANKWNLNGRWERTISERMFGFLTANYLADKFSGYDYRLSLGPGLGYDIIKNEKHQLKGLATLSYYYDKFAPGSTDSSDSYAAGDFALNYRWQIQQNLKFKFDGDYLVSFSDTDKYFVNAEAGIESKINGHVSLGVSYKVAYQNQLPSSGLKHTDTTFLTSLVVDF